MTARGDALTAAMKVEDPSVLEIVKVVSDVWQPLLEKYGRHLKGCSLGNWPYSKCNCGFLEAFKPDD